MLVVHGSTRPGTLTRHIITQNAPMKGLAIEKRYVHVISTHGEDVFINYIVSAIRFFCRVYANAFLDSLDQPAKNVMLCFILSLSTYAHMRCY
jgi:hypothetical protein